MVSFRSCAFAAALTVAHCLPLVDCAPTASASAPVGYGSGGTAASPTSVPIAVGGKEHDISVAFISLMLPEYDGTFFIHQCACNFEADFSAVVHVINNSPNGVAELIPLVEGQITIPQSGLGSNFNNPDPRIPKAIFIGGGFSQYEIDMMYHHKSLQTVPWLYPPTAGRANGTVVPPTEAIAGRVKQVFAEHG